MSRILQAFLENEAAIKRFLARFFRNRQDVEDLAQETFAKAFAVEGKQAIQQPKAFIFQVAKNLALDERAKLSRKMTDSLEDSGDTDLIGNINLAATDEQLEARQLLGILVKAASSLPPQCKQVFFLQRVYGFSHREIADRLGISTSTVEKHVATGLLKCSEFVLRHGCEIERGRLRLKTVRVPPQVVARRAEIDGISRREATGDE